MPVTARELDGQHIWNAHAASARQAGVGSDIVDALRDGQALPGLAPARVAGAVRSDRAASRGVELYGSARACPMCEAAAYWAGVGRMFHGADGTDAGSPRRGPC